MNMLSAPSSQGPRSHSFDTTFAVELERSARELALKLVALPLRTAGISVEYLIEHAEKNGITNLIILDQKVIGIEARGESLPFGYRVNTPTVTITVIDHHVNNPKLAALSTGNLVLEYLKLYPEAPPPDAAIAITHGDCDSVLAAGMMLRALPRLQEFGDAVLAADHSFEANPIADLLQAIEGFPIAGGTMARTEQEAGDHLAPSLERSFRNLGLLLQGKELEPHVVCALKGRMMARAEWKARIERNQLKILPHGTAVFVMEGKPAQDPYPEFLKGLLPQVSAFLVFHQVPEGDNFLQIRALAGGNFPRGVSFGDSSLISKDLVPGFGGRHDAGSNRRGGISFVGDPLTVAEIVDGRIGAARTRTSLP